MRVVLFFNLKNAWQYALMAEKVWHYDARQPISVHLDGPSHWNMVAVQDVLSDQIAKKNEQGPVSGCPSYPWDGNYGGWLIDGLENSPMINPNAIASTDSLLV